MRRVWACFEDDWQRGHRARASSRLATDHAHGPKQTRSEFPSLGVVVLERLLGHTDNRLAKRWHSEGGRELLKLVQFRCESFRSHGLKVGELHACRPGRAAAARRRTSRLREPHAPHRRSGVPIVTARKHERLGSAGTMFNRPDPCTADTCPRACMGRDKNAAGGRTQRRVRLPAVPRQRRTLAAPWDDDR
jgi:hypothetical protein